MENYNFNHIKTRFYIDFYNNSLKIFFYLPIRVERYYNSCCLECNRYYLEDKNKYNIVMSKKFEISADCNYIKLEGVIYLIPQYYNKDSIKNKDRKTLEMLFNQILNIDIEKKKKYYKGLLKVLYNRVKEVNLQGYFENKVVFATF